MARQTAGLTELLSVIITVALLLMPAMGLQDMALAQGDSTNAGQPAAGSGGELPWPPEPAAVERLISSQDYESALFLLKKYISMLPAHTEEASFVRSAADLAAASGFAAAATGDYPGIEAAWKGLLGGAGAAKEQQSLRAAVDLGLGVTYAAGVGRFPHWASRATHHLSAVVNSAPLGELAQAARRAGREYGVKVAYLPLWMELAGIGVVLLAVIIIARIIKWASQPRPNGILSVMSPTGAFASITLDLSTLGPGKGAAFYLDGGRLVMKKMRASAENPYPPSGESSAGGESLFTVSPNQTGRRGFTIWIPQEVEVVDPVNGIWSNYGAFNVERNCEIRNQEITIRVSGLQV